MIIYDMKQILTKQIIFAKTNLLNKYVTNRPIEKGKLQIESKCSALWEFLEGKFSLDWFGGKCFSGF